jgi:hypothetical protein
MKNYYIYGKCPSKPLINEPKSNASWVIRNQCIGIIYEPTKKMVTKI